jgi:hypothetical protein
MDCVDYHLQVFAVDEAMPEPLVDCLVIWQPDDGMPPFWSEAFINRDGVWVWSTGRVVHNPEEITHWTLMPEVPAQFTEVSHA